MDSIANSFLDDLKLSVMTLSYNGIKCERVRQYYQYAPEANLTEDFSKAARISQYFASVQRMTYFFLKEAYDGKIISDRNIQNEMTRQMTRQEMIADAASEIIPPVIPFDMARFNAVPFMLPFQFQPAASLVLKYAPPLCARITDRETNKTLYPTEKLPTLAASRALVKHVYKNASGWDSFNLEIKAAHSSLEDIARHQYNGDDMTFRSLKIEREIPQRFLSAYANMMPLSF